MKRTFLLLLLTLVLPSAVFASSSVDFTNDGGTLSASSAGLSLPGSTLVAINGFNGMGIVTGNLGTLSFSTGALTSGTLGMGGMFAAGGSFAIAGDGMHGIPNVVIFSGSFSGPVTWTRIHLGNGGNIYTLSGPISGKWYTGQTLDGAFITLTVSTSGLFSGSATISSGNTAISTTTVPEPASVTLLGTGLVALTGVLRRKLKR